ncbi:MAG: hypothetical protein GY777_07045, partial [Candidatus Brocadiaceae bacterium]|nr:hypothetical protein [Candidatus Brocadiaceae bacterium]
MIYKILLCMMLTAQLFVLTARAETALPSKNPTTLMLAIGVCPPWQESPDSCKNNVELISNTLSQAMQIPKENQMQLTDNAASFSGVTQGLAWLKNNGTTDTTVIIYYNGHGMLVPDPQTGEITEVFVLWSEEYPFTGIYAVLKKIWMSSTELSQSIAPIQAKNIIVIADTCHAKKADKKLQQPSEDIPFGSINEVVMVSARANEFALSQNKYALFTKNLAMAIKQNDDMERAFNQARS